MRKRYLKKKGCHRGSFSPNNAELNLGIPHCSFTENVHVHGHCSRCRCHCGSLNNRYKQYRITTNQIFGRERVNLSLLQICLDESLQLPGFDDSDFGKCCIRQIFDLKKIYCTSLSLSIDLYLIRFSHNSTEPHLLTK